MEQLLAMTSFDEEGTYPRTRKILSWTFETHIDEPEFEISQGELMKVPKTKGINPLVNSQ